MNERFADRIEKGKTLIEEAIADAICEMLKQHGITVSERFEDSLRIRVDVTVHPI